jgi:aspartyl protease family protein
MIRAQTAKVETLKLGTIRAYDLPVVVSPAFGDTDVLGMNFLSRLKSWRVEGQTLILEPHHPKAETEPS